MGVDFYTCQYCEETFCDAGEYEHCDCGKMWCSLKCAEKDGYRELPIEEQVGEKKYTSAVCDFCQGVQVDDCILIAFALRLLGMSREEVIEAYRKSRDSDG